MSGVGGSGREFWSWEGGWRREKKKRKKGGCESFGWEFFFSPTIEKKTLFFSSEKKKNHKKKQQLTPRSLLSRSNPHTFCPNASDTCLATSFSCGDSSTGNRSSLPSAERVTLPSTTGDLRASAWA